MTLKVKIFFSSIFLIIGSLFSLNLSMNIHQTLSNELASARWYSIAESLNSIFHNQKHMMIFLVFECFVILVCITLIILDNKPYQSSQIIVTPDISTPVSAGQNQFGSAKWLSEKKKGKVFATYKLDYGDQTIQELIDEGKKDFDVIKKIMKAENIDEVFSEEEVDVESLSIIARLKWKRKEAKKKFNFTIKMLKLDISTRFHGVIGDIKVKLLEIFKPVIEPLSKAKQSVKEFLFGKEKVLITVSDSKKKSYIDKGGIIFGHKKTIGNELIYYLAEDSHTLCIGATRSGKGRNEILQTIATLGLSGESMILSDPKGELFQYTNLFLKRLNYDVKCIDFKNPDKSDRYNFLQPIIDYVDAEDIPRAIEATWDLTAQIVGEATGERIWRDGEASIIAASIMAVVYDNQDPKMRKYQNMTNAYYFIAEMCKTINNKMPIMEYVKRLKPDHPARALLAISEIAPSKTRGSFYTAALTNLRLFTSPLINAMSNASDYSPADLGKKKMALFIILPDQKDTYYGLASLLVAQHYEQLVKAADERGGRLINRVNFILDEFGNFAKMPNFAAMLTVAGGRGMRFTIFLQGFSQLEEKYGKDTSNTIKGNCENWIYLQTDTYETLEEVSKKLGNYTVSTYSLSASNGKFTNPSSSQSVNLTSRSLLDPSEVKRIKRPYSLVTSRNDPAIMYSPDLIEWMFNIIYGMGGFEHNRILRDTREKSRPKRDLKDFKMELWGVWTYFAFICEAKPQGSPGEQPMSPNEAYAYRKGNKQNEDA